MIRKYQPAGRINSANYESVTTEMQRIFSQHEFESAVYKNLAYGDESKIAEGVGRGVSIIAQMYSPDNERESNLYKAATEIAALIDIDKDRGCRELEIFCEFVKRALPAGESLCADRETGQLAKETADVTNARINKLPIEDQLREARENKLQAEKTYESIYLEWCEVNSANNGSHK